MFEDSPAMLSPKQKPAEVVAKPSTFRNTESTTSTMIQGIPSREKAIAFLAMIVCDWPEKRKCLNWRHLE